MTVTRALVLGGGGLAGIAWETGVLAGLASAGADVTNADLLVGTSAGDLYRRLTKAPLPGEDLVPAATLDDMTTMFVELARAGRMGRSWRRRVGARALAAATPPEAARRDVMAARLPVREWPETDLAIVAVDANTGEPRVFRRDSGAGLVDAVTASCALPLLWPPATIGGSRYVDGGVNSVTNADLAKGYDRVLILAPVSDRALRRETAKLRRSARVHVIRLDPDAVEGEDLRDPATRVPAARTGHAQGVAEAATVADLWQ